MSDLRYKRENIESGRNEFYIFDSEHLVFMLYYSVVWDGFVVYNLTTVGKYRLDHMDDINSIYSACPDFAQILIKNIDAISEMPSVGLLIKKEAVYEYILPKMELMI